MVNLSLDVTLNIITDKAARFISVTAMHRVPPYDEVKRADWHSTFKRGNITVHVVGRGDELTRETLLGLVRSYVDGGTNKWVHVDLSALERNETPITPIAAGDKPMDFANDPVWRRIMEINGGGK